MIAQIQILHCNNEKRTTFLLVHKKVVPLFQDELYINANHASMSKSEQLPTHYLVLELSA